VTSSPPEVHIAEGTVVLDKYRVSRTIGIGGMGVVVRATHTTLGNEVAIKFLLPQFAASQDAARRFVREAQAASRIASEHIARVFDTGTSAQYGPYIVMEYLEGTDLSRQIRNRGRLDVETAIDFAVQAALALAEAHASGIVHRDVKPANLFVVHRADGSPVIKVLDFGISKVAESSALDVTKTSAILGSGLYMSPEQMKASKNVDHRTDVYGLTVSLYELLTTTQPFTADSFAELCIKVNMEPPTDIRRYRPDIPAELARAIERGIAKKPDERYGSMAELAQALAPWANPHTRIKIDALQRLVARHPRAQSSPSLPPPASFPPPPLDGDLRIPPPPSMPTPSSVGMDTFGLSGKKQPSDPLGATAEKTFATGGKSKRASSSLLGVGVGVGVLLGIGAVGAYYGGLLPSSQTAASAVGAEAPAASAAIRAEPPVTSPTAATSDEAPSVSPVTSADEAAAIPPSASASSKVASSPTAKASGASSGARPAPPTTAAPSPTWGKESEAPAGTPCGLRDIDGTVKPCPK
jgi:serine/threonine-protein kinase